MITTRLLISGGPGSGCTSTARAVAELLGLPVFDSDAYFHKPTEPPFQEQYSPEERRGLLAVDLRAHPNWILSGSVATWGIDILTPTHGVFLDVSKATRLERLLKRQRQQFGARIDPGGDMAGEHQAFMLWAAGYEESTGIGRNLRTDRTFLKEHCYQFLQLTEDAPMDEIAAKIAGFCRGSRGQERSA